MSKLLDEIKIDLNFVGSHTLQPRWYKVLKVVILVAFVTGYWLRYGAGKTLTFVAVFIGLMLLVHLAYRAGTHKYQRSWLDFKVVEVNGVPKATSPAAVEPFEVTGPAEAGRPPKEVCSVEGTTRRAASIGPWYYVAVALGALLAYAVSQWLG